MNTLCYMQRTKFEIVALKLAQPEQFVENKSGALCNIIRFS